MLVSMFDSFFDNTAIKSNKIKSILSITSKKHGGIETDAINALYNKRNKIAHGQIHLLDIHVSKQDHFLPDKTIDLVYDLYSDYINEKIRLYVE